MKGCTRNAAFLDEIVMNLPDGSDQAIVDAFGEIHPWKNPSCGQEGNIHLVCVDCRRPRLAARPCLYCCEPSFPGVPEQVRDLLRNVLAGGEKIFETNRGELLVMHLFFTVGRREEAGILMATARMGVPRQLLRMRRAVLTESMIEGYARLLAMKFEIEVGHIPWAIRAWAEAAGFVIERK